MRGAASAPCSPPPSLPWRLGLRASSVAAAAPAAEEAAPRAIVRLKLDDKEYSLGRADAPLTIVEFTDYQCPYCRQFQAQTFAQLKKNYIDTGKLRFIVRDLPLEFHSAARPAAEAAHCAAEQGKFWEMHHALLDRQRAAARWRHRQARHRGGPGSQPPARLHECRPLRECHRAQFGHGGQHRHPRHARHS